MKHPGLSRFLRHGGRLDIAKTVYQAAPEPWLDLSTGINPRCWRPPDDFSVDTASLPSISALTNLETTAARFFGCDPSRVVAVPGSEIALRLLGALGLPQPIAAVIPSYGTHAEVANEQFSDAVIEHRAERGGTILIANPNNPDGQLREPAALLALAARLGRSGGSLVIDEAFADVDPAHSVIPHLSGGLPITVLRSFGKFFGLAGVRLGFVIGSADMVRRVRALVGDWPVSAHAIAWGTAAYADAGWIAETRAWLRAQAELLDAVLARHGLRASGTCPLFRLVEHEDAPAFFDRLAHRGILTRPFAAQPRWMRFGLPCDDAALGRLDRALGDS